MLYAFDLDGTLFDSRDAVYRAYVAVGVTPPADFFGRPWRDWLVDEVLHDAKNIVYSNMVARGEVRPLPMLQLLRAVYVENSGDVVILTGASQLAAKAVLRKYGYEGISLIHSLSTGGKVAYLNDYGERGIVFDDDAEACEEFRNHTRWTVCHVRS